VNAAYQPSEREGEKFPTSKFTHGRLFMALSSGEYNGVKLVGHESQIMANSDGPSFFSSIVSS